MGASGDAEPSSIIKPWLQGFLGASFLSLGFLAWSIYAVSIGLGFVRIEVERYAVGALYSLVYAFVCYVAVMIAAYGAASVLIRIRWPRLEGVQKRMRFVRLCVWWVLGGVLLANVASWLDWLGRVPFLNLWTVAAMGSFLVVETLDQSLKERQLGNFVWRAWFAILVVFCVPLAFAGVVRLQGLPLTSRDYLIGGGLQLIGAFAWAFLPPFKLAHYPLPEPPTGERIVLLPKQPKVPVEIDKQGMLFPLSITLLLTAVSIGMAVLPHIEADLGGAKPRHAYLVMRPQDFDNETRLALFPQGVTESVEAERTFKVTVLFRNSDLMFIRVPPNDSRADRSFELPVNRIQAILWID